MSSAAAKRAAAKRAAATTKPPTLVTTVSATTEPRVHINIEKLKKYLTIKKHCSMMVAWDNKFNLTITIMNSAHHERYMVRTGLRCNTGCTCHNGEQYTTFFAYDDLTEENLNFLFDTIKFCTRCNEAVSPFWKEGSLADLTFSKTVDPKYNFNFEEQVCDECIKRGLIVSKYETDTICTICQEPLAKKDYRLAQVSLGCHHTFHQACVGKLKVNMDVNDDDDEIAYKECPNCRFHEVL